MKAQSTSEYFLIIGFLILIGLIAIGIMGGLPTIGGAAVLRDSAFYWNSQEVALSAYDFSESDATLKFLNNLDKVIILQSAVLDGTFLKNLPVTLAPSQSISIVDESFKCSGEYSYELTLIYEVEGISKTFTGDKRISGVCSED